MNSRVLIITVTVLVLCGCVLPSKQPLQPIAKSQTIEIRVGASRADVVAVMGNPDSINTRVGPSGIEETFIYAKERMFERMESGGASTKANSMVVRREALGGANVTLRFSNGTLVSLEGL